MSENGKQVKEITSMNEDFAKWYTDIVKKAELMDYSSVKGCMVIEPYGYAIWENMVSILDKKFKELGHQNVSMPVFIPESLLQKEKDHIEGFAPEVAWVTHGGNEKLQERLCVRPTSETLFCEHFAKVVHSWRDLPKLYNQWCNVVRWEKTTRPFLRSSEFQWQEGHTLHETPEEAKQETIKMLDVYYNFFKECLAIPAIKGQKTESEKFAGAESTYTIEALMHDGKALQSATSHYFGNHFAKAFEIEFQNRDNKPQNPFQTSWGCSTRMIGAIIMAHGDDRGLVLPPKVAPIQVVIIPIAMQKEGVLNKANEICEKLKSVCRVKIDDTEKSPGWKFSEYEMKGVPLRLEIGPKDIEKNQCVIVRRDNLEKMFVSLDDLEKEIPELLKKVHEGMYQKALERKNQMTHIAHDFAEFKNIAKNEVGFIKAMWCGDEKCEKAAKEQTAFTSRCIKDEEEKTGEKCAICGKNAKHLVYWAKAY